MAHPFVFVALTLAVLCISDVQALYAPSDKVALLDDSNFDLSLRDGIWMVEFYAPWCGHCKNLVPEWKKTAKGLTGIVNVAAIDADSHRNLAGQYGVQGFPSIKFMYHDGTKVKAVDYKGGRTASEIIAFALDKAKALALKRIGLKSSSSSTSGSSTGGNGAGGGFYSSSSGVVSLTDENFNRLVKQSKDLWYVEFFAPWCGHCKALKPEYEDAARQLEGKVRVGAVNCDEEKSLCSGHGIRGFPTVKFVAKGRFLEYEGSRDARGLVDYAVSQWAKYAPAPEVKELTGPDIFNSQCEGPAAASQLCIIVFLPDILDTQAAGRNAYLDVMRAAADKFKDRPFSYLWAAAGQQAQLEHTFGVGGYGYPAVVAYSPKRGVYVPMREALEKAHLAEFVQGLRAGARGGVPVEGVANAVASIESWDGSDAQVQTEEEFSLDDIMSQEL